MNDANFVTDSYANRLYFPKKAPTSSTFRKSLNYKVSSVNVVHPALKKTRNGANWISSSSILKVDCYQLETATCFIHHCLSCVGLIRSANDLSLMLSDSHLAVCTLFHHLSDTTLTNCGTQIVCLHSVTKIFQPQPSISPGLDFCPTLSQHTFFIHGSSSLQCIM